jgi:N-acetylneuraminate synthase
VDLPLIEYVAGTGKPMILSTGMSTEAEIDEALEAAARGGTRGVALLKCTSAYPAPYDEMNLRAIPTMRERFGVPVGLSDHTLGHTVACSAVTLGACIVEKHLTLARADGGPDAAFSLEPREFAALVENVRIVEQALGRPGLGAGEREKSNLKYRRSLFVVEDVAEGEALTVRNVRSIRPADGLPPKHLREVIGRRTKRAIERGTPLRWEDID